MAEAIFRSPVGDGVSGPRLRITDETDMAKVRIVGDELYGVLPGHALRNRSNLVYSTSPNEWTMLGGAAPEGMRSIDLTHVRAVIRISGSDAVWLLAKVCALDFDARMFPPGAAARTSVAKTVTEVVRDDVSGEPSYLLVTSRSFGEYLYHVLVDQAQEFEVQPEP